MKKFGLFLVFLTLLGCTMLSPKDDEAVPAADLKVLTLESSACGNRGFGTSACLVKRGTDLSGQKIAVRVPNTNTQNQSSTIQISSQECRVDRVVGGKSGQWIEFDLAELIGVNLKDSCDIRIVVAPYWQNQDSATFDTHPMLGRILVLAVDFDPAPLTYGSPFSGQSFARVTQRGNTMPAMVRSVTVDSKGSVAGSLAVSGCGQSYHTTYEAENPTVEIPLVTESCVLFGTLQPLDAPNDGSFAIAIDVVADRYTSLRDPILDEEYAESDPDASSFEAPGLLVSAGKYKLPKELKGATYEIRQTSTAGRASLSFVKDGKIQWSLQ